MDEETQIWKDHAAEMKKMRGRRRWQFGDVIKEFRGLGFEVKEITPYQVRFNDCIDIYPSNKRYHDLKNNKRGDLHGWSFREFLRYYFNLR